MKRQFESVRSWHRDDDGYWAYLKPGYVHGTDNNHVVNAETWKEFVKELSEVRKE